MSELVVRSTPMPDGHGGKIPGVEVSGSIEGHKTFCVVRIPNCFLPELVTKLQCMISDGSLAQAEPSRSR